MKKLLLLLAFLICLNSFSQELSNGGIPADGITPILREQKGINFNTVLNKNIYTGNTNI